MAYAQIEAVRQMLFEPGCQSLTNTPLLSNSVSDRTQKYEFAEVMLQPDEVSMVINGLTLGIWEKYITFDRKLDGLALKVTQSMRSLDVTPRQNTDFQLHLMSQTRRSGSRLDYTLIFVTLIPNDILRPNTYLFYPYSGDTSNGDVFTYEPVSVNVFREFHIFVMQASGKQKSCPTLSNMITSFQALSSGNNPLCFSAPCTHEVRQFLNGQMTVRMLEALNLRLQDPNGTRYSLPLGQMAAKSKMIARRVHEANPGGQFHWCNYTSDWPLIIEVPFFLTQNAVRICQELAIFGRTYDEMMMLAASDLVTAAQLCMFLEMDQTCNALAYISTLSVMLQSHLHTPAALMGLLKAILNTLDVKDWTARTAIECTGSIRAQGPMMASLLLGFIGTYEGMDSVTGLIMSPELKNTIVQSVHFMICARA